VVAALLALALGLGAPAQAQSGWADEVIYFVMLDRFADGDPTNNTGVDTANPVAFHGGDLSGLTAALDEIDDLGATAIWVSPLVAQIPGSVASDAGPFFAHHGYWANDFSRLDARFGTEAELAALVTAAHARGIRVILDVVYNHVGYGADWTRDNPEWLRQGDDCGGDPVTACIFGLPDIRTELAAVRRALFAAHIGLAERTGLDGFRLDTVKHVSHDFWRAHAAEVRARLGPDFLLLGEVWDGDKYLARPYFEGGELDALLDFGFRDRMLKFLTGVSDAARLGRYLSNRHKVAPGRLLAPFLSNHDMPMLLAMLRGDRDRQLLAATALLTAPGLPVITWGEEVGRRGGLWPDNRQDMPWGDRPMPPGAGDPRDEPMRAAYKALIALRRDTPALRENSVAVLAASGGRLALERGPAARVFFNRGPDAWDLADLLGDGWSPAFATQPMQGSDLPAAAAAVFLRTPPA